MSLLLQKFTQNRAVQNTGKTPVKIYIKLINMKVLHINTLQLGPIFTDFFKYINDTTTDFSRGNQFYAKDAVDKA